MKGAMKTTVTTLVISFIFGMVLYATLTLADPTGPNQITELGSERGSLSNTPVSVDAQAGNLTELTIDSKAITNAWQGYYGNITGSITLEDASGNVFYNWTGLGSIAGEVYASRNDSVTWAGIECINNTEVVNENSYLGKADTDSDSVNNTFSTTTHPEFNVGSTTINTDTCRSTNAYTSTGQDTARFHQVLLADTSSNTVYTTLIDDDQTGFDTKTYDFELLVGENGNATSTGSTPYYFYIEIS